MLFHTTTNVFLPRKLLIFLHLFTDKQYDKSKSSPRKNREKTCTKRKTLRTFKVISYDRCRAHDFLFFLYTPKPPSMSDFFLSCSRRFTAKFCIQFFCVYLYHIDSTVWRMRYYQNWESIYDCIWWSQTYLIFLHKNKRSRQWDVIHRKIYFISQ